MKDATAVDDVFFQRRERDRPTAFVQGQLFASKSSVDHGEDAERRTVVRLRLHDFFLLRAGRFKSSARSFLVFGHARQQPFTKAAAQIHVFAPAGIVAQRDERSFGRSRIAFGQRAKEPDIRDAGNGVRFLRQDCIDRLVERPRVPFPTQFK